MRLNRDRPELSDLLADVAAGIGVALLLQQFKGSEGECPSSVAEENQGRTATVE